MAGLRKGHCYNKVGSLKRSYSRTSKYKNKAYIKGIPPSKIAKFELGNPKGTYTHEVALVSLKPVQIRHNAIEASRQVVVRRLELGLGASNFLFKVRSQPHQVMRENKIVTGAHADRIATGMAHSFGQPIGLAAQLMKGKPVFSVCVAKEGIEKAKDALKAAPPRIPGSYRISVSEIKK